MRPLRLLVLLAALAAAALWTAGAAAPAGGPTELLVDEQPFQLSVQSRVDALLSIAPTSAPTARIVWYVPRGYTVGLTFPVGTKLGTGSIKFATSDGVLAVQGSLTTDDPAKHPSDPCALGTHAAVWLLTTTLAGLPFTLALYVDPPAPNLADRVGYQIQACFDPPLSGRTLAAVDLTLTSAVTNPATPGRYLWRALVTPYGPNGTPDPVSGVEAQALMFVPHSVTVKTAYSSKRKRLTISGVALAANGRDAATPVIIYSTPDLTRGPFRRLGTTRTDSRGSFSFVHTFAQTAYVVVSVERTTFGSDCEPTISSNPCSYETVGASDQTIKRIVVR